MERVVALIGRARARADGREGGEEESGVLKCTLHEVDDK